jgi:hypothetical protein
MPIVCRLLGLEASAADELVRNPGILPEVVTRSSNHMEVYWFWHGIDYLLGQVEAPSAVRCLRAGGTVLPPPEGLPATRLHSPKQLEQIARDLREVAPEALLSGYDPRTMDTARVYPERWAELDEEHDILGDLLEHYAYMQEFAGRCAAEGQALLVFHERRDDETDF